MNKLKGWLKPNELTPDPTDYNCIIESFGSAGVDEIIRALADEGMELKPETVRDVVTRYNRKCAEMVFRGINVNTGLVLMRAVVKGAFFDKKWDAKRNKLYVAITQGAGLRAEAANTTVEIMGEHPDPIAIYGIADLSTGKTDGTLTRGFNAELKGSFIKITGDDEACGLYLRNADTGVDTKLEARYIAVNDPSKVMFIVPPAITEGAYELRVVTQYTVGAKPLKQPRSVTLQYMLEIA